jgi:uncharacterized membrane protein SpoIIM required for sporulation
LGRWVTAAARVPYSKRKMDIDRFLVENGPSWERLAQLTARSRHLSAAEVQELARLYQRAAGNLAYAQVNFATPDVVNLLTRRVAGAYAVLYGARRRTWRTAGRFFSQTLPLEVWQSRWFVMVSAVALLAPAVVTGTWLDHSRAALDTAFPAAVRQAYVGHDFAAYYRSLPAVDFATQVYVNNALVAFEAFAGGILFGLGTLAALLFNGVNIGAAAGAFYAAHRPGEFWALVTPHGLLELTSVVLAGAAGLRLGWALVAPGDKSRSAALAEAGPRAVVLVLGTAVTLAVAGSIEGFVTGSSLPAALRVGVGAGAEAAFLAWMATGRAKFKDARKP